MAADKHMIPGELREVAASALERAPQSEGEWVGGASGAAAVFMARLIQDEQGASFLGWVYEGWLFVGEMAADGLEEKRGPSAWLQDQLGPRCVGVRALAAAGPWVQVDAEFRGGGTSLDPGPHRTAGARPAWQGDAAQPHVRRAIFPHVPRLEDRDEDCLVVIHCREPALLGKRFLLDLRSVRIGRGADNHVVLDGDTVSRHHAHLEKRHNRWFVFDDGSTNGVYLNGQLISREAALSDDDRVKIGSTIFRLLAGVNVESRYHEEIYRVSITDGLTGAHNKPYFRSALGREIVSCRRAGRDLAIVLFTLAHLQLIKEEQGQLGEDFVLMELARLVLPHLAAGEVCAHLDVGSFALLLPDCALAGAKALASSLQHRVSEHIFLFNNQRIPVGIRVRSMLLQEGDTDAAQVINQAEEQMKQVSA